MDYKDLRDKTPDEIFEAVAKDTGVPTSLLTNMWNVESGKGTNMKSPAGATGHMQIMPRELGVMRKTYGEDLDPMALADSVFMAGKMLKENMQHFGNIPDAVSAYNGGWTKSRWDNDETRAYTPKVLAGTGITIDQPYVTTRAEVDAQRPQQSEPVQEKTYLNNVEKNSIEQLMLARQLSGTKPPEVVSEAVQLQQSPELAFGLASSLSQQPVTTTYDNANAIIQNDINTSVKTAERIENGTAEGAFRAASQQYSLTTTLYDAIANHSAELADKRTVVDTKWQADYEANRDTMIKGLSPYAVKQMDKAINPQEAADIVERDKRDAVSQQVLNDSGHPILWGLTAGILDPAGWAVGAGVGKAFTIGKGISTAMRMTKMATANAAGNVVLVGAMDALGQQITPEDYIHAGAFGLATGAALGVLSRGDVDALAGVSKDLHENATTRTENFVNEAAKKANFKMWSGKGNPLDGTDPEALVRLYPDANNVNRWTTAPGQGVDQAQGIWVRTNQLNQYAARGVGDNELHFDVDPRYLDVSHEVPTPADIAKSAAQASEDEIMQTVDNVLTAPSPEGQVFRPNAPDPVETGRVQSDYGLDTITDEERLSSIGSLYKSAENFISRFSGVIRSAEIAGQKNRILSDTLGWRSAGNELLTDDNPLAKSLGMAVAEDSSGVSGWRGITVAIKSKLLNNYLNHNIERGLHENFEVWLKQQGVGRIKGALETYTTGRYANSFYVQVAKEIRNRADDTFVSSAPRSVQDAANVLERGFQEMGDIQRRAKTLGNEFIPEKSRGYLPQQLNGKAFASLSAAEKRQVQNEFQRQATKEFGWDTEFATKKVAEYMNRAEDNANGVGQMFPGSPRDLMSILMKDLEDPNLTQAQQIQIMERMRNGAAKHTHKRLDWDLNASITRDDGSVMPISELYNNDILSLYKGYANRVAGDVAFAHVGLYGERDIRLVTEALQRSKVGDSSRTIPAWQQIVNEVYSRPTAVDAGGNLSTAARFIRQYTGIRLLGGVGFAQAAELTNAVSHLGVVHTMNLAARIPKVWKDLKTLKAGEIPENPILSTLDIVAGSPLGSEQFQMVMPQIIDEGLSIVDQRSFNNVMRVMGGAQLIHNKFSFMRAVSAVQQRVVSEEIVRKAFRYMKSGQEDVALREMGFTPELQAKLMKEMDNIAQFDSRGYLQALNVMHMEDKSALLEMVTAVRRGTGQIIQETFPGETGKWMRSEIGQLLMQFRKFPSVAIEKQMYRQYGKFGFTRALGGTVAAMGLGTIMYYGRAQIAASLLGEDERKKFLEQRLSTAGVANGAIMYVSALGMTNDFLQLGTGVGNLLDDQLDLGWSNSRGVQGQGIGGLIPSLGTLGDVYNYTQNPSGKAALKLLPFSNLPMVLPAINALKHNGDDN